MTPATSTHSTASGESLTTLTSLCLELRDYLQRTKRVTEEEIRSYPTPIPRCDAQFNFLYEHRARLSQQLEHANRVLEANASVDQLADVIAAFVASTCNASSVEEQALRARLSEAITKLDAQRRAAAAGSRDAPAR
jgi:hypothetical protein